MAAITPPTGLDRAGKALWKAITAGYEFRPDELAVLEDACRTADIIAAMEKAWAEDGRPMTTRGSQGQLVAHPLISELRQYRSARATLLRQLKLPDEGSTDVGGALSTKNRAAANARWARRGA
jgi:hypothetical protein